jgi:hypothetical protein
LRRSLQRRDGIRQTGYAPVSVPGQKGWTPMEDVGNREDRATVPHSSNDQRKRVVRILGFAAWPFTEPALLAGLWVLPAMLDVLDHYTITELRRAATVCFPALKQIGFGQILMAVGGGFVSDEI